MTKKKQDKAAEGGEKKERERKKNWTEVYATVEDIKAFLADRVFLRHNVITGRVEYHLLTRGLEIATTENGLLRITDPAPAPPLLRPKGQSVACNREADAEEVAHLLLLLGEGAGCVERKSRGYREVS